jgi:glutamate--cysteine ligase
LRNDVPAKGINAELRGRPLREIAREVLALSRQGLKNRARQNRDGYDETSFLTTLDEVVARGTTSAEELLSAYHTRWGGSIEPVFLEYAY